MNKKYIKYIEYIVNDIEAPYYFNMKETYGLKQDEVDLVLSKLYNQPVTIKDRSVYDSNGNKIYYESSYESSYGSWVKYEYDDNDNLIYRENSDGSWIKQVYDDNGNRIYREDSDGFWIKNEYDSNDNIIYYEHNNGIIQDNR
jgi:YD repeat-containing protein